MSSFIRWSVLTFLIMAAVICYFYGSSTGMLGFFIVGALFEVIFWLGLFSRKDDQSNSEKHD